MLAGAQKAGCSRVPIPTLPTQSNQPGIFCIQGQHAAPNPERDAPSAWQGPEEGGAGAGAGAAGHTCGWPCSSAGKVEQNPEAISQLGPVQPQEQVQPAVPSAAAAQRPLGVLQLPGQPSVACGRAATGSGVARQSEAQAVNGSMLHMWNQLRLPGWRAGMLLGRA